jgi:hypothetical protein
LRWSRAGERERDGGTGSTCLNSLEKLKTPFRCAFPLSLALSSHRPCRPYPEVPFHRVHRPIARQPHRHFLFHVFTRPAAKESHSCPGLCMAVRDGGGERGVRRRNRERGGEGPPKQTPAFNGWAGSYCNFPGKGRANYAFKGPAHIFGELARCVCPPKHGERNLSGPVIRAGFTNFSSPRANRLFFLMPGRRVDGHSEEALEKRRAAFTHNDRPSDPSHSERLFYTPSKLRSWLGRVPATPVAAFLGCWTNSLACEPRASLLTYHHCIL